MSDLLATVGYETAASPLRRQPSRRRRSNGLLRLFAGALVRALLLVGAPGLVLLWLLYSPYFLIRDVQVEGEGRVSTAWVEDNLRPLAGRHILAVSLEGVRRRLSAHPWVASVELRRELPDRLRVLVVERQPVARLATAAGPVFLDADGEPIVACPAGAGGELVLLHHSWPGPVPVQAVLGVVGELQRVEPIWGLAVREVEVLGEEEFRVSSGALPFALLLRGGAVREAVGNLRRVLPELDQRFAQVGSVDLRQPRRLVVRPAAGSGGGVRSAVGAGEAAGAPAGGAR